MNKIYKQQDLDLIQPIINESIQKMNIFIDKNGLKDGGTCVMGEGLYIDFLPKGKRKPIRKEIVGQPFQGNNYRALKYAQQFLLSKGITTYYDSGRMD